MLLQNVMLAAKARGLDTCPQVAPIQFHRIIKQELGIPDGEVLICAMSMGHADPDAPENALRTERMALDEWVSFRD
jgi:nitroreductase